MGGMTQERLAKRAEPLRLWDASTGQQVCGFTGHTDWVRSVAFTPDGKRILSGSDDETVRLWDTATGDELAQWSWHSWSVTAVAVSPDGRFGLSGSDDMTMCLWELPADA